MGDTYEMDIGPALEAGMGAIWVMHRPEKEKKDVLNVLNGDAPCPNVTLGHISDLDVHHIHDALAYIEDEAEV